MFNLQATVYFQIIETFSEEIKETFSGDATYIVTPLEISVAPFCFELCSVNIVFSKERNKYVF